MTEHATFCRICEPTCGMVATVEGGGSSSSDPDNDHPITKGFSCPKGIEFVHVQNDPDRLLHPMRRAPTGEFERISWQTALDEIGAKLRAIRARHGGESIAWYAGNPSAFSHSHAIWAGRIRPRRRFAPSLHAEHPGHVQPVRRVRAALRQPDDLPAAGPAAHDVPADGRRQPAGLPRLDPVAPATCARS